MRGWTTAADTMGPLGCRSVYLVSGLTPGRQRRVQMLIPPWEPAFFPPAAPTLACPRRPARVCKQLHWLLQYSSAGVGFGEIEGETRGAKAHRLRRVGSPHTRPSRRADYLRLLPEEAESLQLLKIYCFNFSATRSGRNLTASPQAWSSPSQSAARAYTHTHSHTHALSLSLSLSLQARPEDSLCAHGRDIHLGLLRLVHSFHACLPNHPGIPIPDFATCLRLKKQSPLVYPANSISKTFRICFLDVQWGDVRWEVGLPRVALVAKSPPANAGDLRNPGLIPGLGRAPGGEHGNPLQYSCLENPIDRRAWWAMVHRIAQSQTGLKWLSTHTRWEVPHWTAPSKSSPLASSSLGRAASNPHLQRQLLGCQKTPRPRMSYAPPRVHILA